MKTAKEIEELIEFYGQNKQYEEGYVPDGYDIQYYQGMVDALEWTLLDAYLTNNNPSIQITITKETKQNES